MTLALLGALARIVVSLARAHVQKQHERELRRSLREIRSAIDAYKAAPEECRIRLRAGATGYPPTLDVLVEKWKTGGMLSTTARSTFYVHF